ncbi:phosphoglycerate mutase family protein [Oceanobacillus neutriphilus]|uniref:Histidine phosphatase family protein n=1 Tax=Oceanobacillus neutriphilus TaxID=531815 RepID=A0ABQ2NUL3_9BACI|nr:phosphoglycerate mutase family protein [Oceanobacillus neutriphilus]GGP10913.1 histidine phosphatase family protein [Oceanobacillus neutriphilus]
MELHFIRHGEAEHNMNEPKTFQITNPDLTPKGVSQAKELRQIFHLKSSDLLLMSPSVRTIETAIIFANDLNCEMAVVPMFGPKIFPYKSNSKTLPCDKTLSYHELAGEYPFLDVFECKDLCTLNKPLNSIKEEAFMKLAYQFFHWCRKSERSRIFIITHDGTINSYLEILTEKKLTRDDMLSEGKYLTVNLT